MFGSGGSRPFGLPKAEGTGLQLQGLGLNRPANAGPNQKSENLTAGVTDKSGTVNEARTGGLTRAVDGFIALLQSIETAWDESLTEAMRAPPPAQSDTYDALDPAHDKADSKVPEVHPSVADSVAVTVEKAPTETEKAPTEAEIAKACKEGSMLRQAWHLIAQSASHAVRAKFSNDEPIVRAAGDDDDWADQQFESHPSAKRPRVSTLIEQATEQWDVEENAEWCAPESGADQQVGWLVLLYRRCRDEAVRISTREVDMRDGFLPLPRYRDCLRESRRRLGVANDLLSGVLDSASSEPHEASLSAASERQAQLDKLFAKWRDMSAAAAPRALAAGRGVARTRPAWMTAEESP